MTIGKIDNCLSLPAISSNSLIRSLSNRGGRCLEKKSFKAVATAFTGMSRASMSMLDSAKEKEKNKRTRYNHTKCHSQMLKNFGLWTNLLVTFDTKDPHVPYYQAPDKYPPNLDPLVQ